MRSRVLRLISQATHLLGLDDVHVYLSRRQCSTDGDSRFGRLDDLSLLVSFDISVDLPIEVILESFVSLVIPWLLTREAHVSFINQPVELLVELCRNLIES